MESIDDLVNELNKNTNYEEILIEIINSKGNNTIKKVFEEISQNNDLTKKQKEKIYNSILDYSNEVSKNFKNKIEDIHKRGFKEGSLIFFLIDSITRDDLKKRDEDLELAIQDFILGRLQTQNKLENNQQYRENKKKIEKIRKRCHTEKSEIVKELDELYDLYEFKCDLEQSEAYNIGFRDALKFMLYKPSDKE